MLTGRLDSTCICLSVLCLFSDLYLVFACKTDNQCHILSDLVYILCNSSGSVVCFINMRGSFCSANTHSLLQTQYVQVSLVELE